MSITRKDFISLADHDRNELETIIEVALEQKCLFAAGALEPILTGKTLACIFHKPSLRTRISFETAMTHLGGSSLYITDKEVGVGSREAPKDVARVLSRYVDGIMIRTFEHELVETLAHWADVPVINGLTDLLHPCQIMADLLTVREKRGSLDNMTVVFVGDGNNVARSWINACSKFKFKLILACPEGFGLQNNFVESALGKDRKLYREINDPVDAVVSADVIYTDVWASMGEESRAAEKKKHFETFQLNKDLLKKAPAGALVMHCLPAHRGEEITDEVIESDNSVVFDQAENRLHAQRSLLALLMAPKGG